MRALSANMPARRWPGPWKTAFSTARTATVSIRRARRRAPSVRRSCGGSSASILSLNAALSCACCIPHSRNCGAAPEPKLRGGFLRRMPEKTAESDSRRVLPPQAPPAALWMFPCAEYAARQKLCPANAGENRRIRFEVGLAPSSTPAALWMFPCAEYEARQKLCPAHCA